MAETAYHVAPVARGTGALAYTYLGPAGQARGQLCLVRFRGRPEPGVVLGPDEAPPEQVRLERLVLLNCSQEGWGRLLLDICELACAAPHEVVARLALSGSAAGMRLELAAADTSRLDGLAVQLRELIGPLTLQRRRRAGAAPVWEALVDAVNDGTLACALRFAGMPGVTSASAALRSWYAVGPESRAGLGLGGAQAELWPGTYLAGLETQPRLSELARARPPDGAALPPPLASELEWEDLSWPPDWDCCRRWPAIAGLRTRRAALTLPRMLSERGLPAELATEVAANRRVLLLAPQGWMLDRLWPRLAGIAAALARHDSSQTPGQLAAISHALAQPQGFVVAAAESGWRLAAYARFDRVIVLDPSHPQWQPEGTPWLDPRLALLLACSRTGSAVDFAEFGAGWFDGAAARAVMIHEPHVDSPDGSEDEAAPAADRNPLPLTLRQADRRRLVYFNRLGSSRGISCAECAAAVVCPRCGGRELRYSQASRQFMCPSCGFAERELRCRRCGLASLASRLPGLEAVRTRPGEVVVSSEHAPRLAPETMAVLGTAQLLRPVPAFWPQQVVYIDPEQHDLYGSDWRGVLDMAARLASLYANPELESVHVVSQRLAGRLPGLLDQAEIARLWQEEAGLRRIAGLPPYGCLYQVRVFAATEKLLHAARETLGQQLSRHPGTALLRLGAPFRRGQRCELHGMLLNPAVEWEELQTLRWLLLDSGCSLGFNPLRGPWL